MAETQSIGQFLNPWALHLQKLSLELKCPLCLNLLNKPMLLPCDHIFCNSCVPKTTQFGCKCPVCKIQYVDQEIRAAPHMESMTTIYKSLDATFSAYAFQSLPLDAGRAISQSPISVNADDKSSMERYLKATVSSSDPNKENNMHSEKHLVLSPSDGKADLKHTNRLGAEEIDMKLLQQQSPGCSFSSDDNNNLDRVTCEQRNRDTGIGKLRAKRLVEDNSNAAEAQMCCIVRHEHVSHGKDAKRQKKLNHALSEMSSQSYGHLQQNNHGSEIIANCNFEYKLSEPSVAQPKEVSDQLYLKGSVCAFCQSSKITEGTGPFLYYANGREVVGIVTSLSKVIPVHRKCIDWTPQVYYDGDAIKNLEAELARAAKLKCSGCGLKGAALGCYMKSCRRTYHMPCAFEIQDCRWDCDNFLMLCPSHKSVRFPSEKKSRKQHVSREARPDSSPLTTELSSFWASSSGGPKEWVLCGSALSSEEKYMLVEFANMCGATVCKFWNSNVTHVVAATDDQDACTRTLKVLMAILSGKWILTMDWVKACIQANGPMNEEPYEISLDNHGCSGGPRAGRLRASTNAPKLFDGFKFYLSGDYVQAYKTDLLDLVEKAGGAIIQSKEQLIEQNHAAQETHPASLVVYNRDVLQASSFEDESNILQQRLAEAEDLAKQIGCQVIQHTWILESIAACKLVPFC